MEATKSPTSHTFTPIATPQGWLSWYTLSDFFASVFANISQAFWGDNRLIHSRDIAPLPKTITPETLTSYIQTEFTPKIPLAQRAIQEKNPQEAGRMIALLQKMKAAIKAARDEDVEEAHDYAPINPELAKVEGLVKQLDGILPAYPKVPQVEPDTRIHPSYGLTNGGNTCFINTILQIVFVVPELVKHIVFGEGQHLIVRELYQQYVTKQQAGEFRSFPNLSTPLRGIVQQFEGIGQHDAFEFLLRVLVQPLKSPETNPLFFEFEERTYYHDYETHREQITDHFEEDGGRIAPAGRGNHSSLQLVLPTDAPYSTMEELIRGSFHEEIPKQIYGGPEVEFERGAEQGRIRLQLAQKHQKIRIPPFFFVDFKRFSVTSLGFREGGTFRGTKNTTPITFTKTFFIPPEFDMDGKGAKCEWVALVNGGGFGGGHYVADVSTSNGKYYEYSDSSKRDLSEQDFIRAGEGCYGGFVRVVECEDVAREMAEHREKTALDQEIGRAGFGKWGNAKELEQIALFNKYLNEAVPSLEKLQRVYDKLPSSFHEFVKHFFPESPRDHLVELKAITKPLLCTLERAQKAAEDLDAVEVEVATHIVAQYEHIRRQNLELARDHRTQTERDLASLAREKAHLEHLLGLHESPADQAIAAAIIDPGLEKLINVKGIETLLKENALETEVVNFKQVNADIRAGRSL